MVVVVSLVVPVVVGLLVTEVVLLEVGLVVVVCELVTVDVTVDVCELVGVLVGDVDGVVLSDVVPVEVKLVV